MRCRRQFNLSFAMFESTNRFWFHSKDLSLHWFAKSMNWAEKQWREIVSVQFLWNRSANGINVNYFVVFFMWNGTPSNLNVRRPIRAVVHIVVDLTAPIHPRRVLHTFVQWSLFYYWYVRACVCVVQPEDGENVLRQSPMSLPIPVNNLIINIFKRNGNRHRAQEYIITLDSMLVVDASRHSVGDLCERARARVCCGRSLAWYRPGESHKTNQTIHVYTKKKKTLEDKRRRRKRRIL